jgi:hypothetical protein
MCLNYIILGEKNINLVNGNQMRKWILALSVDAPITQKTYFEMSKYSGKCMDVNPDILCLHTKFHAKSDIFCVLCKKDNFWCQNSYSQNVFFPKILCENT